MGAAAPLIPVAIRVTLRPVIIPLGVIAGLIVVRGIAEVIEKFVRAVFGTATSLVSWIPWLNKRAENGLHRVEARITNYLAQWEVGMESRISTALHSFAHGIEDLAKELEEAALLSAHITWLVTSKYSVAALAHKLGHLQVGSATTKAKEKQQDMTLGQVKGYTDHPSTGRAGAGARVATKPVTVRITNRVSLTEAQVAALTATIEGTLAPDIEALRERTKALTGRLSNLYRWVRRHERALSVTLLGSVAVAFIARLGGGWIFCRNWKRLGRTVCRTPAGNLDFLLGLFALAVVALDPEEVVEVAEEVADDLGRIIATMAGVLD